MKSFAFPNIFNGIHTNIIEDKKATASNLKLLMSSIKKELFGDPYFGNNLLKFLYDQNNIVLRDLVIDEIYTTIATFMPQLIIYREDITIASDGVDLIATIQCTNKLDNEVNLYTLNLTTEGE